MVAFMDEKNASVPGSPANTETEHLGSEQPENVMSQEMSAGGGGGGSVSTGTDMVVKRKRGRPRKYDVGADVAGHVSSSPVPVFSSSDGAFSESNLKRGRGRPRGSGKLQQLASLGGFAADTAGGNFTPHVVNVQTGEDVYSKIISFSQKGPRAVCILSATGVVSSVVIRQPGSSGGFLRYEGRFEILSLDGSFIFGEVGGNHRSGMLSISLAKPDGRVFGGGVASSLIAAGPIQLIVGSFKQDISKELDKRRYSAESSAAANLLANSELVRVPGHLAQTIDADEGCVTPSSALLEPPAHGGAVNAISANQRMNHTPLQIDEMNPLQASQAMPDRRISPDINTSLPQF